MEEKAKKLQMSMLITEDVDTWLRDFQHIWRKEKKEKISIGDIIELLIKSYEDGQSKC